MPNVEQNIDTVRANLKTLLNFKDEEIHDFVDKKRLEVEKALRVIKGEIDEENENEGKCLLFLYYVGRC